MTTKRPAQPIEVATRALKRIAEIKANSNSEPDVMGEALDKSQDIALSALAKINNDTRETVTVTEQERDTILAALRL